MNKKLQATAYMRNFAYHVIFKLPWEDRFNLKGKFYPLAKSDKAAKRFIDRATNDEIHELLTMLGFEWFTVIFDTKTKPSRVGHLFEGFDKDREQSDVARLINQKLFISSSREMAHHLGLASVAMSDKGHIRFMELARAGYHARKWSRQFKGTQTEEDLGSYESMTYLAKTMMNTYLAFNNFELTEAEIVILLQLYARKNSFLSSNQLKERLTPNFSTNRVTHNLTTLTKAGLISFHSKPSLRQFSISALGIHKVNKFYQQVLTANNF